MRKIFFDYEGANLGDGYSLPRLLAISEEFEAKVDMFVKTTIAKLMFDPDYNTVNAYEDALNWEQISNDQERAYLIIAIVKLCSEHSRSTVVKPEA